jgi:hypothetical protein
VPRRLAQHQLQLLGEQMSDDLIDKFLRHWIQYIYPNRWEEVFGTALIVVHDDVGIFISNIPGEGDISFAAGVLTGLELSTDLVDSVANVNRSTKIGSIYLSKGEADWQIIYTCKLLKSWIDPSSRSSAQMIVDILSNIPDLVNIRARYLREQFHPVEPWPLVDGWSMLILSHM